MLLNLGSPNHTLEQCMKWVVLTPLPLLPGGRKQAEKSAENFDHSGPAVLGVIYLVIKWGTDWGPSFPAE